MPTSFASWRPPAPAPHPGSLGPLRLAAALWSNPIEAWTEDYFTLPIVVRDFGFTRIAVVSDPAAIRRVLVEHRANYQKDTMQRRIMSALNGGLLTAEDAQWREQRRMLAPIFTVKTLRTFAPAMVQAAEDLVQRWRERSGEVVNVSADVTRLTLEVLELTIFSEGLGRNAEEVRAAMRVYFDSVGRIDPFDVLGIPKFVPRFGKLGALRSLRLFRVAVDEIIRVRRERVQAGRSLNRDILTLLLEARDPDSGRMLSEEEVKANIITFIVAGHETTANAITWSLYLLAHSWEWLALLRDEIDRTRACPVEDLAEQLPMTRAVLEEALRLYPPLPAISRGALQADRLAGVEVAKGTLVVISPYVVHRHRKLWIAPDIFDPGRFLAERESIDPFAFLPFGRGPRGCIGITFAMQEATLVLATLLAQCEFECVADQAIWPVHRITLTPRGGLNMRVRPRVSAKPAADRKAPEQISTGPAAEAGAPGSLEFTP